MDEQQPDAEVAQAITNLDWACEKVAEALGTCGQLVNDGRMSPDVIMLKINELAARLAGGVPA